MRIKSKLRLAYMVVGIIIVLSYHSTAKEWEPNQGIVQNLISLSETEIESTFPELVPEQERVDYAILVGHYLIFELSEDKKAERFLSIAQKELENQKDNKHAISVNMLYMVLADKNEDRINVIKYGEKTLELMRKEEGITLDQFAFVMTSVGDSYYTIGDFSSALRLGKELVEYAKKDNNIFWQAEACFSIAESEYQLDHYASAESEAQKAYALYLKLNHNTGLGHSRKVIGNAYLGQGRLDEAKENYEAAMSYYQKVNDHHGLANCYFNLGLVFNRSKKWKEAVDKLETALFHYIKSGSAGGAGLAKMELGNVFSNLEEFEKAEIHFNEAKSLLTKTNSLNRLASLEFSMGNMSVKMGQKQKAIEAYNRALTLYRNVNNNSMVKEIKKRLKTLG